MRKHINRLMQAGSDYANSVLATEWGTKADQWLRDFVQAKSTPASQAMDADYLRTHIGGGWHRLFDGGHDLWGAFKATRSAHPDDSFIHHLGVYAHELWKDLATPNGLPVIIWNKTNRRALTQSLHENLHVSTAWVHDMATFTATELGGAVAALVAILINLRSSDPHRYFELCGSLGLSAIVAANPILTAVWVAFLLNGFYERRMSIRLWNSFAIFRGLFTSFAIILTVSLLGPFGLIVAIPVAFLSRKLLRYITDWIERRLAVKAANAIRWEFTVAQLPPPAPLTLIATTPATV
jgi:hypothetical protein